jgi:NitT/TauT family transport system ATP-binding protein
MQSTEPAPTPPVAPQASGPPVAALREVSFTYPNGTAAVADVTFDIPEGRVVGICGPSGCGKSSLLALLAGIRAPSGGAITWSEDPQADTATGPRHPISMVFQKDTLLPWLTVDGNVRLYATLNRRQRAQSEAIIPELLELTQLSEASRSYPYQLSGGMRRRLAFITAMAAQPRLLLLDEPFSALDEPTRIAIHQDVLTILRRLGTTVVLVTHDLAEATSLCDEIIILTARPGTIATRHEVPFGRDRNVLELRERKAFLELYGQLWHDLSRQMRAARTGGDDEH